MEDCKAQRLSRDFLDVGLRADDDLLTVPATYNLAESLQVLRS